MKLHLSSKFFAIFLGALSLVVFFLIHAPTTTKASVNDTVIGAAWSSNIGWINMNNCDASGICNAPSYGVTIAPTGSVRNMTGYAWSSNIGWISFNATATTGCPVGPCQARVEWGSGGTAVNLKGWARACSVFANAQAGGCSGAPNLALVNGGWDGWIALGDTDPTDNVPFGVTLDTTTGLMSSCKTSGGCAWGSDVLGWIDFTAVKLNGGDGGVKQCSDGVDNADPEDKLADTLDPGCHTDGIATNANTYDSNDDDETDTTCTVLDPCWCVIHPADPSCGNSVLCPDGTPAPNGDPAQCGSGTPSAPVVTLTATPNSGAPGMTSMLTWTVTNNPTSCNASGGNWNGQKNINGGSQQVGPLATIQVYSYTLTCTNAIGSGSDTATVTVANGGGGPGKCSNIPASVPVAFPPYKLFANGTCGCAKPGYVLNPAYQCAKPTYKDL